MPVEEFGGGTAAGTRPDTGQGGGRRTRLRQGVARRVRGGAQHHGVGVECTQIEPVLQAVPLSDLVAVQGQIRVLVAADTTGPDVGLDILDGAAPLGQPARDIQYNNHRHPIRAAAP